MRLLRKKLAFWLTGVLIALFFAVMAGTRAQTRDFSEDQMPAKGEFFPGEVVVLVRPGVPAEEVRALAAKVQARVARRIPEYRLYLFVLPRRTGAEAQKAQVEEAMNILKQQPQVENAYPNYKFSIPRPIEPITPQKPGGGPLEGR